jgi:hypothetical protein
MALTSQSERIALLVHILCELRTSHGITASKLKDAGRSVQQLISPARRVQILDKLYLVREEEEVFLEGFTGESLRLLLGSELTG